MDSAEETAWQLLQRPQCFPRQEGQLLLHPPDRWGLSVSQTWLFTGSRLLGSPWELSKSCRDGRWGSRSLPSLWPFELLVVFSSSSDPSLPCPCPCPCTAFSDWFRAVCGLGSSSRFAFLRRVGVLSRPFYEVFTDVPKVRPGVCVVYVDFSVKHLLMYQS